jgi:HK97 family phage major capsid protein
MPATATPTLKDRLKEVRESLSALRDTRAAALIERDAAKKSFAGATDISKDSPEFLAAKEAVRKVGETEDKITDLKEVEVGILEMLGQHDEIATATKAAGSDESREQHGWNAARLLQGEDIRRQLAHAATTQERVGPIRLGEVASRETLAADIAPTSNQRRGDYYGIVPQLLRPLTILDILPTATMNGNLLPYTVESGSFLAAETAEGSTKPEDSVIYTDASAQAQTIAAWMKIRKQALEDVQAMQGIIDNRLRYSVRRRLEAQVLNGNGSDPNLRGILQTSGIGAVAFDAGELVADQILSGITLVLLADAMADGIALHPTDWQTVLKAKASGDGHYFSGGPFTMTPQVMWGIPLIPSKAIPVGHSLVGDYSIGATLFIRTGVSVSLSDSDQDDFIRNRMTLLGEMRAALAVFRPSAFVDVDLSAAP